MVGYISKMSGLKSSKKRLVDINDSCFFIRLVVYIDIDYK
jgi:hypothetical protein